MVGYTGGRKPFPVYRALGDHTETTMIQYDPEKVKLEKLLEKFWKEHNPIGRSSKQYKSGLWYQNEEQREIMQKSLDEQKEKFGNRISTTLEPVADFYRAEEYHQRYLGK